MGGGVWRSKPFSRSPRNERLNRQSHLHGNNGAPGGGGLLGNYLARSYEADARTRGWLASDLKPPRTHVPEQ